MAKQVTRGIPYQVLAFLNINNKYKTESSIFCDLSMGSTHRLKTWVMWLVKTKGVKLLEFDQCRSLNRVQINDTPKISQVIIY